MRKFVFFFCAAMFVQACVKSNEGGDVDNNSPGTFGISSATPAAAKVTLTWSDSTGAVSYTLKRGTSSGVYPTTISTSAVSPFIDSSVRNGTTYYYVVQAIGSEGTTVATTTEASAMPTCALGTTWSTLDTYSGSENSALGYDILVDSSGNIYTAGIYKTASSPSRFSWLVRKSADRGITWSNVDSFQYAANTGTQVARTLAIDSNGWLFAAGYGEDGSGYEHWIVRRSQDEGSTWSTVDDFQATVNKSSEAYSIAIDSSDNIYVAGNATLADSTNALVVRKSTNGGTSWSTVSSYQRNAGFASQPNRISTNPANDSVVISASLNDTLNSNYFTTRLSSDGGTSWSNPDEFRIGGGSYGYAEQMIFESGTSWTAFGHASDGGGLSHLIARTTTDSGTSWTTVLDEVYSGIFYDSLVAYDGFIYSAGYKSSIGWKVRKSSTDFSTSADIDTYNYVGTDSIAYGIAEDSSNNLLVVGYSDTNRKLIVRKLTCE